MKKIFTLLLLFTITLSSSFAATGLKTTLNTDDLLSAEIFYINGEGYTKENNRLKKVENVKFYSIAGQRYIKKGNKIEKINETKIFKINNISYVKSNNRLVTLVDFLKTNKVKEEADKGTFSDMYKETLKKVKKEEKLEDNIFKYILEDDEIKDKKTTNTKEEKLEDNIFKYILEDNEVKNKETTNTKEEKLEDNIFKYILEDDEIKNKETTNTKEENTKIEITEDESDEVLKDLFSDM